MLFPKWRCNANENTDIQGRKPLRRPRTLLTLELLEDRVVPAMTWYVDASPTIGGAGADIFTASGGSHTDVGGLTLGVNLFMTIGGAITAASGGDTIKVADGTYTENLTLNKSLTLQGNQFGVDARSRAATETIVTPSVPATRTVDLQAGSAAATIDGFTFSDGTRAIESGSGPLTGLQILNNRIISFTNAGIFLNDSGTDITLHQNVVDGASKTGGGGLVHLDTDSFAGFHLTSNNIVNGATGTGFFVDGNRNVGPSTTRNPLFSGNLISGNNTGMNLGTRAFGSLAAPVFGANNGEISGNTFSNNNFDGLQGGMARALITQNTFSGNGRSGLALTSFGNTGADRGAQNNVISENFFSTNTTEDLFVSASMTTGAAASNTIVGNSFGSAMALTYNGPELINASANWWGSNTTAGIISRMSRSEIQLVTVTTGVTGGQFTLTFGIETTDPINHNASAAAVQSALLALTAFDTGDVVVTTGAAAGPGVPYIISFQGAFLNTDVAPLTANDLSLTGGTPPLVTATIVYEGLLPHADFSPWLDAGTDTAAGAGFQGSFATLHVDDDSPQTAGGRIAEAIGLLPAVGTVNIHTGAYAESVTAAGKAVTLSPGGSPGQVTINGNLTLDGDDTLRMEIDGVTPGTLFDQFVVNGDVTLGGAALNLILNLSPFVGSFKIIDNDLADNVSGTFAGKPDDSIFLASGVPVFIDYNGGGENDVVISSTAVAVNGDTLTFIDDDLDTYTVTFTGKVGQLAVAQAHPFSPTTGPIASISVFGTDAATNTVKVKVKQNKNGGDGKVNIGSIIGDAGAGLKTIDARRSDLDGTLGGGIQLDGALGRLRIYNVLADVEVDSLASASLRGGISDSVWTILGGEMAISVRGNINDWQLDTGGSIKSMRLGVANDAAIRVETSVRSFRAATFTNSYLFVGFNPANAMDPFNGATSANFAAATTVIKSFTVYGKIEGAFANSTIAADQVGKVSLSFVTTNNATQFGVLADESIKRVKAKSLTFDVSNLTLPLDVGIDDFRVVIV